MEAWDGLEAGGLVPDSDGGTRLVKGSGGNKANTGHRMGGVWWYLVYVLIQPSSQCVHVCHSLKTDRSFC